MQSQANKQRHTIKQASNIMHQSTGERRHSGLLSIVEWSSATLLPFISSSLEPLVALAMVSRQCRSEVHIQVLNRFISTCPPESEVGSTPPARRMRVALPWLLAVKGEAHADIGKEIMLGHLHNQVEKGNGGHALALCLLAGLDGPAVQNAIPLLQSEIRMQLGQVLADECIEATRRCRSPRLQWLQALLDAGADASLGAQNCCGAPTPLGVLANNTADMMVLLPSLQLLASHGAWTWPEGALEALWRVSTSSHCHLPLSPWEQRHDAWLTFWREIAHSTLKWSEKLDNRSPGEHKFITFSGFGMCPAWFYLRSYLEEIDSSRVSPCSPCSPWFSGPGLLAGVCSSSFPITA
jgi:hypothetical protein